jgi:sulfite reductase (NADPH) flavoprotein alpha-component
LPLHTIHNQSIQSFKQWSQAWSLNTNITIDITPHISIPKKTLQTFKVIKRTSLNSDKTFLLQLKPLKKQKFRSGDLFAFYAENENTPRYYSIANYDDTILLSIKKHDLGVCSTLLSQLEKGIEIQGAIKTNQHFHLPKNKSVVLIGNGTGIAPYLGMLQEAKTTQTLTLFWGGKTKDSFTLYKDWLPKNATIHTAFSREGNKQYVQDVIAINSNVIINTLKNKGYIMLCGSLVMEKDVKKTLNNLTLEYLNKSLDDFINQIKTDCY